MEDGSAIGARDLILAILRLAVADYLGVCYGHDEPAPYERRKGGGFQFEGAEFPAKSLGLRTWRSSLASRYMSCGKKHNDSERDA